MKNQLSAPLIVQLEITERCNHNCFYCYNLFNHNGNSMPLDKIDRVIYELAKNRVFSTVITGGEPFTYKEGLYHALKQLTANFIDPIINTNLSLPIEESDLEKIAKTQFILVSFPSQNEGLFNDIVGVSGSYKKVNDNLAKISQEKIPVGINQVVSKKNKQDVYKTGKYLFETFGITSFSASPMTSVRTESQEYELSGEEIFEVALALEALEKDFKMRTDMLECIPREIFPIHLRNHSMANHQCSAGYDLANISVSGEMRTCPKLEDTFGNIFLEGLKEIWDRVQKKRPYDCLPLGLCPVRIKSHSGIDPLPKKTRDSSPNPKKTCEKGMLYIASPIRTRKEGEHLLIFGRESGVIFGNEMLVRFIESIQGKPFNVEDIELRFGGKAKYLLNQLYSVGIIHNEI